MSQRILLTGANGFLGSHVLEQLLLAGHSVRAILRSQTKADQVLSDFSGHKDKLDFGIVPDITAPGAFDQAVQDTPPFDTVIHTASPFLYRVIHNNREFLDPAILGTVGILKAIKQHAPSVKRVVITSSCAAVFNFEASFTSSPRRVYTEEDWNPKEWEDALNGPTGGAYQASKKFAELAAWDFIKDEKPNFDLVTLNPPIIYGPLRHSISSVRELNESNARLYNQFINSSENAQLPPDGLHIYTDVRDIALAHVQAVTVPGASNQRFIICPGGISAQNISDILRKNIPELEKRTPKGNPGTPLDPELFTADASKATKMLGITYRSREETLVDLAKQLLKIEQKEKKL